MEYTKDDGVVNAHNFKSQNPGDENEIKDVTSRQLWGLMRLHKYYIRHSPSGAIIRSLCSAISHLHEHRVAMLGLQEKWADTRFHLNKTPKMSGVHLGQA